MNTPSSALTKHLQQEIIRQGGAISFAYFMQQALYHPEWGYYNSLKFDIGKKGDFITAPEISPVFAKCLARQVQQLFLESKESHLLELGAGTGRLAQDLLLELAQLQCLPSHYLIYEPSINLRQKQKQLLASLPAELLKRIVWVDQLPKEFSGTIIANEVLDALPVQCFRVEENGIFERSVGWQDEKFTWRSTPANNLLQKKAQEIADRYSLFNGYESELNADLLSFIHSLGAALKQGTILFIDYGYGQAEYYHPERSQGTLTCFYQHQRSDNPFLHIGQQDITAHVDFTAVAECALESGFELVGFTSQANFLLSCGLSQLVAEQEKTLTEVELFEFHQAIKTLILPTEMGDRIKVMGLSKNIDLPPLVGFSMQDRRREL